MSDERASASTDNRFAQNLWVVPLVTLVLGGGAIIWLLLFIDARNTGHDVLSLLFHPDATYAAQTLSNVGDVAASVLAIAITVVAIIVELASNRLTHRVPELFVREPLNLAVMGTFVITTVLTLWTSLAFAPSEGFVPYTAVRVTMVLLTLCLIVLLPYFTFVFQFLKPEEILRRMRTRAIRAMSRARYSTWRRQSAALAGIEEIADVALTAMENKDKAIAMESVNALADFCRDYQAQYSGLPAIWFRVEGPLAHNADFVSLSAPALGDVSTRRVWLELKVLRQYQTIYAEALNRIRDVNYLIAINTRKLGEAALDVKRPELVALVIKFFNTYLRSTLNARDVRTAYNVLNQYRLFAERLLANSESGLVVEVAKHFRYYGRVAFDLKLPFVLETVAYDLCDLSERAFDAKSDAVDDLLGVFLEVDKESEGDIQEMSLRGVRKAQIKLATYFLTKGAERLAQRVHRDMAAERQERLASIREELLAIDTPEFWEMTDRGHNFDYLTPARKEQLEVFFTWFGDRLSSVPSMPMKSTPPTAP